MIFLDNRPNKLARVMIELELMSQWVTCQRGRVGSALIDYDGVILVPARNGTAIKMPTCRELGANPNVKCEYCRHSEKNVINFAARNGVATKGHTLATLRRPCTDCAQDIVQAGISVVYYRWPYDTDNHLGGIEFVKRLFQDNGIHFEQLAMMPQEESFHSMITEWRNTWTNNN